LSTDCAKDFREVRDGYTVTSLEKIADEAEYSKGAVY